MKFSAHTDATMSLEREFYCPECGGERDFWRVAAMTLHLGTKTKWRCNDCDHGLTRINGDISTAIEA